MLPTTEVTMAPGELRIPGEAEEGILIGDKRYSGVTLTLDNCLLSTERLERSPSAEQGLPPDTEEQLRTQGCELIQAAGILLRLPQVAMATGQILFQRFFYCKSFIRHCVETVAMACVHLASKIEEEPRRVRDVLNVFHRLKHSKDSRTFLPLALDANYISMKSQVIKAERRVLKELGFCVHVKHPHKIIVMYLQVLECEKNTKLIPLPDQPPWFWLFGASEEDLREICHRILRLYTLPQVSLPKLQQLVAECRQVVDSVRGKIGLGGALPSVNGTPTLDVPTSFSPTSKAGSPATVQVTQESSLSQVALKKVCRKLTNGDGKTRLSRSDERREAQPESHSAVAVSLLPLVPYLQSIAKSSPQTERGTGTGRGRGRENGNVSGRDGGKERGSGTGGGKKNMQYIEDDTDDTDSGRRKELGITAGKYYGPDSLNCTPPKSGADC
ncbi:hypothetical protein JZ751_017691 [Albula glossodonta]|uniref:Cyclin-like domain-containing protein n=1 Tax=Albula glossodonta TaxID=121402 RepID=A0A8T2PP37_9TELE|nr:hypothetical protein JZ751_017691 [Albula glossodonta]